MARDKTKRTSTASSPVYGAATRWLQRIRRKRLLRCIIMSKIGGNKPWRRRRFQKPQLQLQLQLQVNKSPRWYWLLLLVCVAIGLCRERITNSGSSYEAASYCDRNYRLGEMVTHVRRQVPHQEEALDQLERALDNATYQVIALVGSSDVGKSLTASLREHFPWPENIKTLSWRESPCLLRVQSILKNLFQCGQNLILIDDLTPLDGHLVPIFNELIRGRNEIAKGSSDQPHLKQLTAIFMFSLDRQQPKEIFEAEMEVLKQLPRTHVIIYPDLEASNQEKQEDVQVEDVNKAVAVTIEEDLSNIAVALNFLY